jgi:hypothetical protein
MEDLLFSYFRSGQYKLRACRKRNDVILFAEDTQVPLKLGNIKGISSNLTNLQLRITGVVYIEGE